MEENKSILHELYVYSEWKPEPEYIQKPDNILPESISTIWRWLKFFGPKKSLIDNITVFKERQQKWHIALGDEGKVIAVLTDNILEIRTKRSEYATIAARTTVSRDAYPQWRKLVWSPDCSFVAVAYGNGVVSFFDLTASNLFNIPIDCSRPGGLECTDNTHAVADIIFMPLRVKDIKWNWEVLIVTFDGKLRAYLVSQTDGFKLLHSFCFTGGVGSVAYCALHSTLYVAGLPRGACKDQSSPLTAGITAWRILNDDPFYKLSVVSDQLEAQLANERFQIYIPFVTGKNLAFIVSMTLSPDCSKLACLHCNGDVTIWRLPVLRLLHRWPLLLQPGYELRNPLNEDQVVDGKNNGKYNPAATSWWSNEELIISRFSGAITICDIKDMLNILGKKPEFFQGAPQVTSAHDGTFMVLECESNVLPARKSQNDETMEVVKAEEVDDTMLELTKELFKSVLYAITDIETFQPKPRRITIVSRVYRLLGVKSTTPDELFSRKIESGNYKEALTLADTFELDSDLVYQQQWRKNTVSTDAIHKYLSKVSKKIWAVHQCVDRLPETLPAAKELLQFGLELTNSEVLNEINKDRDDDALKDVDDITLEDLNAYTSELLRCRHVMLFNKERLRLYEAILRCEKSTYDKDEYDRLRSNSIVHSSMEIAKEGRIQALICLWPHIKTVSVQLAVLEKLPETINPLEYQNLLPIKKAMEWFEKKSPIKMLPSEHENDWCRKEIFRSIWSSNWSEESSPENETASNDLEISKWYEKRAREIEDRSGLVQHALTLVTLATVGGAVEGLDNMMFHLLTLDTLIYDINVEDVTLKQLEELSTLETCSLLMKMSTPATFVADLKQFVIPFLKRYEQLSQRTDACVSGLTDYLESVSVTDLSPILLVLKSPSEFELDVRTHLELAERCIFAYSGTEQMDKACDLLDTILKESDGSISSVSLVERVGALEGVVRACVRATWRRVPVAARTLHAIARNASDAKQHLAEVAAQLAKQEEKPTAADWEKLLKEFLELQSTLFKCVTKEECYEIYASALLKSGDSASIKLAGNVLTCESTGRRNSHLVNYARSVQLATDAARQYFDSASELNDPSLDLAKCCLLLIKDGNTEIQQELDLIAALPILSSFNLTILPIQVRLCEDRMTLIEDCLKLDHKAYLASNKLLKLATLLRIAGDDERTREGQVLMLVCSAALEAEGAGGAACVAAALRLARLQHAPAAALLAHVGATAARAERALRRALLAAAATHAHTQCIEAIHRDRLRLELESLQQMGVSMKEHSHLVERWPSTDDEFADAVTTPVIERKDIVPPTKQDSKIPLFNYLLDAFQNKMSLGDKSSQSDQPTRTVHCPEFYRTLYPEHEVDTSSYSYDRFTTPDETPAHAGHSVLKWFYIQNCLEDGALFEMEEEVLQKCASDILYSDTALGVACLLRGSQRDMLRDATPAALSAVLYALLLKCNAPQLTDNAYLYTPIKLARTTLKHNNASDEQMELISKCMDRLSAIGEVESLKTVGCNVSGTMFNADKEYREEIIYRLARSKEPGHLDLAKSLGSKYGVSALDIWLRHAAADLVNVQLDSMPSVDSHIYQRVKECLWPQIEGCDHNALISLFNILRNIDDKPFVFGLTASEHIKLLKKAKAASPDLDYKLIVSQPSPEDYTAHILQIAKAESIGMLTKFLRSLPSAIKPPVPCNVLFSKWLVNYFFNVPPASASSKKWMQQYRSCSSYFSKLSKDELLEFLKQTCFSLPAVERVPSGTRNLMLLQAADYCQQEQENEYKFNNKSEPSWAQVGQELTRWARFLENYHSDTIQSIIDSSQLPREFIWQDIEMSHGSYPLVLEHASRLLIASRLKRAAFSTLLQCLHVDIPPNDMLVHAARHVRGTDDIQTLVARLTEYSKDGVKIPDDTVELVMQKASEHGLPPHKQIALMSLSQKHQVQDTDDMMKIANVTADLFTAEWSDSVYAKQLTEESLMTEEGRRECFHRFANMTNNWQRKKALVDALTLWPATRNNESRSLQCEYLEMLLTKNGDQKENLVLIKLLLRKPVLTDEEVKYLADVTKGDAVINAIWIVILSKSEHSKDDIISLVLRNKESVQNQEIDDDLVKELLDSDMFIKLVPTPIYAAILNYILSRETSSGESNEIYTVQWASKELLKFGYIAEAGHLKLTAIGVPNALRGFSQSIIYCKNILRN